MWAWRFPCPACQGEGSSISSPCRTCRGAGHTLKKVEAEVDIPAGVDNGMQALGERMAAQNGYSNQFGWELYYTTGTTEDYSYNATGGYGYTFEIGPDEFHPP